MGLLSKLEKENAHIADEMVEHLILEKIGGLPDHGHAKGIKLKKRIKRTRKNYNFEFYAISFIAIAVELWLIGDFLLEKYPSLKNLFTFLY